MRALFSWRDVGITGTSIMLLALSAPANALSLTCSYRDTIYNGEVDFGSGNHAWGGPRGSGSVRWNFTSVDGAITTTARVRGRLYLDKIGGGCARLRVNF